MFHIANRMISAHAVILVVVAGIALSGCAGGGEPAAVSPNPELVSLIEEAHEAGASSDQIAVLELALAEGRRVTFEEYKQATYSSFDCLEALGLEVVVSDEEQGPFGTDFDYGYGGVSEAEMDSLDAAMEACIDDHSKWIDLAYHSSGSAVDADDFFEPYRPLMIECVNQEGAGLPTDATLNEAVDADFTLTETDPLREMCAVTTGLAGVL